MQLIILLGWLIHRGMKGDQSMYIYVRINHYSPEVWAKKEQHSKNNDCSQVLQCVHTHKRGISSNSSKTKNKVLWSESASCCGLLTAYFRVTLKNHYIKPPDLTLFEAVLLFLSSCPTKIYGHELLLIAAHSEVFCSCNSTEIWLLWGVH